MLGIYSISSLTQEKLDEFFEKLFNGYWAEYHKEDALKWENLNFFFDKTMTPESPKSKYIRSIFVAGGPVEVPGKNFKGMQDRKKDQQIEIADWHRSLKPRLEKHETESMSITPISRAYVLTEFALQVNKDTVWVFGSVAFVFFYITCHTKSVFLSLPSLLMIILSFPLTIFIYYYIFKITLFTALHSLVLFIVMGISADNIFVFFDAWQQSESKRPLKGDLVKRIAYTFKRSAKAMSVTSSTTAVAFLANGFSS